ncbi:MAG: hypothetical protein ACLP9L_38180 [Thermoguttaceae bacterium]
MLIVAVGTIFACHSATRGAPPAVTVEVHGVRVVKPPPGGDEMLRAFNSVSGTAVALVVTEPHGGLVVFDPDASHVKSFVDDSGKDLTKGEPGSRTQSEVPESWGFMPDCMVSKNRKHCCLEVAAPGIPSRLAATLALSGSLVFELATEREDFTTEDVALRAGSQVNAGIIPLTIKFAGKPRFGGDDRSMEVEFHAKQKLDAIVHVRFFDGTGNRIETEEAGRGVMTDFGPSSAASVHDATICYRLKDVRSTAKIVVTCWTDIRQVVVPFDMKVNLGL